MTEKPLLLGIDDAGRGPVLCSMILAGVLTTPEKQDELKQLGVKDSKLLLSNKRKKLSDYIKKNYKHFIVKSTPKEIDDCENLNTLEALKSAMIINKLTENLNQPVKIIIDCPSVNTEAWTKTVLNYIKNKKNIQLSCEHKADINHPIVSAASIIAKEKREDELIKLKSELNINFGSGYPSDPKTKEFIRNNHNNPKYKDIIRFSWNTVKKLKKEKSQQKLF